MPLSQFTGNKQDFRILAGAALQGQQADLRPFKQFN